MQLLSISDRAGLGAHRRGRSTPRQATATKAKCAKLRDHIQGCTADHEIRANSRSVQNVYSVPEQDHMPGPQKGGGQERTESDPGLDQYIIFASAGVFKTTLHELAATV